MPRVRRTGPTRPEPELERLPTGAHVRVGLVHNPTASRGRTGTAVDLVRLTLIRLGYDVLSVAGDSYDSTRQAATGLLDDSLGLDALIVVGGDGMVHLGLDVVARTGVPLGIVPTGTGNDLARHLGIAGRDVPAAVAVIHHALTGTPGAHLVPVDAIHCTRPDGAPVPDEYEWCLAVVSAGLDAAVNARANTLSWPAGEGRYVRALPYEIGNLTPYGYRVTTDAGVWQGGGLLLAVANSRYFGGGMPVAPQASLTDGLLDVIRLDPVGRSGLLRHFTRLRQGTHMGHPQIHHETSRVVTIEALDCDGLREPPHPMADGEPIAALPLRLEAVRGAVVLAVPDQPAAGMEPAPELGQKADVPHDGVGPDHPDRPEHAGAGDGRADTTDTVDTVDTADIEGAAHAGDARDAGDPRDTEDAEDAAGTERTERTERTVRRLRLPWRAPRPWAPARSEERT